MTTATKAKLTYADYAAMPEDGHYYQLIEGELVMSPSPRYGHQAVLRKLVRAFENWLQTSAAGVVIFAPYDVILADDVVFQPDLVFVSNDRADRIKDAGFQGAPDLCVEVLSPSNARLDRERKRSLYAKHGVTELWIVDPAWRTIERFRLQINAEEPVETLDEKQVLTSELIPGFELKLADVFAE